MEALKQNHNKIILPRNAKKLVILLVFMLFFDFFLFSMPALASEAEDEANIGEEGVINDNINQTLNNNLPEDNGLTVKSTSLRTITAYNSEPGQTDDSPCITANGFNLCEHGIEDTVAANFLPFGAKVRIPELYGDRVFIVRDRMNSKHYDKVDIWMTEKADARNFGVQTAIIEVLE
jgi:3D (Asp-Asp-Asp) domain-containing protein